MHNQCFRDMENDQELMDEYLDGLSNEDARTSDFN